MSRHIPHIDGLKGFCALCVVVFHYLLAFDAKGYVGWHSGIPSLNQWEHFWSYFPLSFFSNASYVLFMFFAIIAFIPAHIFFQKQDTQWIQRQAFIRYFRFVPYTFIAILTSYIFFTQGWYFQQELGHVLQEPWNIAVEPKGLLLEQTLWAGLFGAMVVGASDYVSSLWCMHIIFLGSYLSYAILLFFGRLQHRYVLYFFLWLLLYNAPLYVFFLVGIVVADLCHAHGMTLSTRRSTLLLGLGVLCAFVGEAPWATLATGQGFAYEVFLQYFLRSFGIFAILCAVCQSKVLQNFFTNKIFMHCSRYCFEYIIAHMFVLLSISSWIFIQIHAIMGYGMAIIITSLTAIPMNILVAVVFGKILQPLSVWLSQKVYGIFMQK